MSAAVIPFQIAVVGRGPGPYTLRAGAAGRTAEATLDLSALPDDPAALGPALGQALFPPPLRGLLMDVARGADTSGARMQIQLQMASPELEALPWEWASLGEQARWRPAIRDDYTLVRVGQRARPAPTLSVAGPLRLLIACAAGAASYAEALGPALADAVRDGRLVVDLLRDATPDALADALAEEPCHLLHLIAPVEEGPRGTGPRLRLGMPLDAGALIDLLADQPGLRLITIAPTDETEVSPTPLASALHEATQIATITLADLDADTVAVFCAGCYGAVARHDPVDLAVTDGRAALIAAGGGWGQPRLHLAPGGEQLFREGVPSRGAQSAGPTTARSWRGARRAATAPDQGDDDPQAPHERRPQRGRRGDRARPFAPLALFAVESTAVGSPTRRALSLPTPSFQISPKIVILMVALALLVVMVSRVLVLPGDSAATVAASIDSAPVPTLLPTGQAAANAPGTTAAPQRDGPLTIAAPESYATYVAVAGDTIAGIAERAGSTPEALAAMNRLQAGEALRPGRPLVIPIYRSGEQLPPAAIVGRGNPDRPEVALTFDIEIDAGTLYAILDILRQREVKATFFVTGRWVQNFPEAAKAIVADGHELGNHSLTHPAFSSISADGARQEIAETERIIRETTGVSAQPYFRFPYGDSTQATVDLAAGQGYIAYHWGADDYAIPSWLAQAAGNPAQSYGGILLVHGRQSSVDALPGWLDQLEALGLQATTLSAALR